MTAFQLNIWLAKTRILRICSSNYSADFVESLTSYVKEKKTFGEKKSFLEIGATHLIFTYSKLTTETLEKSVKYVQSLQQKH